MHTFVQNAYFCTICILMNFVEYFFSSSIIFCIKWMLNGKNSLIYANVWLQKMFEYNKHFFADLMPFQKNVTFQKSWNISETERRRQISSNVLRVRTPMPTLEIRHIYFNDVSYLHGIWTRKYNNLKIRINYDINTTHIWPIIAMEINVPKVTWIFRIISAL